MDVVSKITLVASVVLFGYNLYQLLTSYEATCEKVEEFKHLAKEGGSDEVAVKRSNFLLTGLLSSGFCTLVYLSNLAYWVVGIVVLKMLLTVLLSHLEIERVFRSNAIDRHFFYLTKMDAAANALIGIAVAIVVIS